MVDTRFHVCSGPSPLGELLSALPGTMVPGDERAAAISICGAEELLTAGPGHISLAAHKRYIDDLRQTSASAVIVSAELREHVPAAVPGIAFLSGGQTDEEATAHLSAMNQIAGKPWHMTFSYGRALQNVALRTWAGRRENFPQAQAAFTHRARMNSLAALGTWTGELDHAA